jgi:F-type H+-transporting ATPase subunit a
MIRLYANMMAGHVVLMSIIGLMFTLKVDWKSIIFVWLLSFNIRYISFITSHIFTMLSALYFGAGNEEHHRRKGINH